VDLVMWVGEPPILYLLMVGDSTNSWVAAGPIIPSRQSRADNSRSPNLPLLTKCGHSSDSHLQPSTHSTMHKGTPLSEKEVLVGD
jgi:hypothetical protein